MSEFNIEVEGGSSVRLPTAGKYCDRDIVVTATDGGVSEAETMWITTIQRSGAVITKLPDSLTSIGPYAFYGCMYLTVKSLPAGIDSIGTNAFYGCTGLSTLTFNGTPSSIASNAFTFCANLKTINVPWAEGAVSGAPWGATNATINYNYTD